MGLLFIATPHFSGPSEARAELFGITQHAHAPETKPDASGVSYNTDFDKLIAISRRFEALKLSCRVLSFYEKEQVLHRVRMRQRPVKVRWQVWAANSSYADSALLRLDGLKATCKDKVDLRRSEAAECQIIASVKQPETQLALRHSNFFADRS